MYTRRSPDIQALQKIQEYAPPASLVGSGPAQWGSVNWSSVNWSSVNWGFGELEQRELELGQLEQRHLEPLITRKQEAEGSRQKMVHCLLPSR